MILFLALCSPKVFCELMSRRPVVIFCAMKINLIKSRETLKLRQDVLRPHQTAADCIYPGDDLHTSFHLGCFSTYALGPVGVLSAYCELHPELTPAGLTLEKVMRIRGVAVSSDHQKKGIGQMLMHGCLDQARERRVEWVWCNARESAATFYDRFDMQPISPRFEIPDIGPHFVYARRVG